MKPGKNGVSAICRKRRPRSKSGACKDEAGCYIRYNGTVTWRKLGAWGASDLEAEYEKILREWHSGAFAEAMEPDGVTLIHLFNEFLDEAVRRYKQPEMHVFKLAIGKAAELFPEKKVKDVSAMNFRKIREGLVEDGRQKPTPWSRQYINRIMAALRTVFRWGISYDYTPVDVMTKIESVPSLREWEATELEERPPVEDVPDWVVLRTLPFMSPVIADMVKIQRAACMRPGEVCSLRVGDLDRTGKVWVVRKKKHKTSRFGLTRFFAFGPAEVEILRRRCQGKGMDDYIFSPRDAQRERWVAMRAKRKTPVQPSQVRRSARAEAGKLLKYKEKYDSHSYNRAIKYAQRKAQKAGVRIPDWFPYQLRHAAVTANSLEYGQETASVVAGHKSLSTTARYDHKGETVSVKVAGERETV